MQSLDSDANSARFSPASKPDNHTGSHNPGWHHFPVRTIDQQQRAAYQQRRANSEEIAGLPLTHATGLKLVRDFIHAVLKVLALTQTVVNQFRNFRHFFNPERAFLFKRANQGWNTDLILNPGFEERFRGFPQV